MSEVFRLVGTISSLCLLTCFLIQVRTLYPEDPGFSFLGLLSALLVLSDTAVSSVMVLAGSFMGPAFMRLSGAVLSVTGMVVCLLSTAVRRKGLFLNFGIYSLSRNPFSLSVYLISIGNLLMFFSWISYLLSVLTVFFVHLYTVTTHEKLMYRMWGDLYADYEEHVRCYLGRR